MLPRFLIIAAFLVPFTLAQNTTLTVDLGESLECQFREAFHQSYIRVCHVPVERFTCIRRDEFLRDTLRKSSSWYVTLVLQCNHS